MVDDNEEEDRKPKLDKPEDEEEEVESEDESDDSDDSDDEEVVLSLAYSVSVAVFSVTLIDPPFLSFFFLLIFKDS